MGKTYVRAAALTAWQNIAVSSGAGPNRISNALGIGEERWNNPDERVDLATYVKLSERIGEEANSTAASWAMGESYDLARLEDFGSAILSATTLGGSLRRMADLFALLQDATEMRLVVQDGCAEMRYRILDPDIWPRHHDAMFTLGILAQLIRRASRDAWHKAEVVFEAKAQQMRCDLAQAVGTSVSFDGDENVIRFPVAFLDLPVPVQPMPPCAQQGAGLKRAYRLLVEHQRRQGASDRVSNLIFSQLNDGQINQERLAKEIGMSGRTLRRRLSQEGLSFQDVLDDCRMRQAALEFRTRPSASIAQIALRLGYSEHSTFTRAFQRWSGVSPQTFRNQTYPTSAATNQRPETQCPNY